MGCIFFRSTSPVTEYKVNSVGVFIPCNVKVPEEGLGYKLIFSEKKEDSPVVIRKVTTMVSLFSQPLESKAETEMVLLPKLNEEVSTVMDEVVCPLLQRIEPKDAGMERTIESLLLNTVSFPSSK